MISKIWFAAVAVGAITIGAQPLAAGTQEDSASFVRWATAHAMPLQTIEPGSNISDLADLRPLKAVIGAARVVALGEPAHGAHEPLAFRNRLFRYLVEELGFTAIALESGLPESRALVDFVAGGPGNAGQVARENLTMGFGDLQENTELVQWIREYNADASHPRKVRIYGIDLSLAGWMVPTRACPSSSSICVRRATIPTWPLGSRKDVYWRGTCCLRAPLSTCSCLSTQSIRRTLFHRRRFNHLPDTWWGCGSGRQPGVGSFEDAAEAAP